MDGRRLTHIAWITAFGLLAACGRPTREPAPDAPPHATDAAPDVSDLKPDEGVRLFPTLARWTPEGGLVIPIRGWVFEPGDARLDAFDGSARDRLAPFLVDSERGKLIVVRIAGDAFRCEPSDEKGQFTGEARLRPHHPALDALRAEAPEWLPLAVVTPEGDARTFDGAVLVPAREGVAIVCDLDDTLKVSNVRNRREQFDAAILEDWVAVAGMPALVRTIADETGATTHYLSAARWPMQPGFEAFLAKHGAPRGTFHLREFNFSVDDGRFAREPTPEHKRGVLRHLFDALPRYDFILIGDSAEADPQVYGELARAHPGRVRAVLIRLVEDDRPDDARLLAALEGVDPARVFLFHDAPAFDAVRAATTTPVASPALE